jgi:hypothetical protein
MQQAIVHGAQRESGAAVRTAVVPGVPAVGIAPQHQRAAKEPGWEGAVTAGLFDRQHGVPLAQFGPGRIGGLTCFVSWGLGHDEILPSIAVM